LKFVITKTKYLTIEQHLIHYNSKGKHILLFTELERTYFLLAIVQLLVSDINLWGNIRKRIARAEIYVECKNTFIADVFVVGLSVVYYFCN